MSFSINDPAASTVLVSHAIMAVAAGNFPSTIRKEVEDDDSDDSDDDKSHQITP